MSQAASRARVWRGFRRAFGLLLEQRGRVLLGLACMPLSALVVLEFAELIGAILDALRGGPQAGLPNNGTPATYGPEQLRADCLRLAGLAFADAALRFTGRHFLVNASRHMEQRLKSELSAHLNWLPIAWFDRARTGDLLSRLTQDVELIRFVTGPTLLYGTSSLVLVPGAILVMVTFSPIVAAGSGLAFAIMLGGILTLMPRLQRHSRAAQEAIAAVSQRASEGFAGIRVLTSFGRGGIETEAMRALSWKYAGHNIDLARLRAWFNLMIYATREGVVIAVIVLGAFEAARGNLSVGQLLSFLALLGAMVWPLIAIGWIIASWHRAVAAAERIEEIFETEPEPCIGMEPVLRGDIRIDNLTFSFAGQQSPSLSGVSLRIPPGEKVGLVGRVGSGKSTLLSILLRWYDPPRGCVYIDDHDILDLAPAAVRRLFATAAQDPFLFSGTLSENIGFARNSNGASPESTPDQPAAATTAAKTAGLDFEREGFADGAATLVGERGVTLSGGQKQRVSLARALAAERDILLLDDTLSAVDVDTERRVLDSIAKTRGDRSLIVATHRLSIVEDADRIVVLDGGQLIATGTHPTLLRDCPLYADAWQRQQQERRLEGGSANGKNASDGGSP